MNKKIDDKEWEGEGEERRAVAIREEDGLWKKC